MTYFRKFVYFKDDKECDLFVCYVKKQNKNKEKQTLKEKEEGSRRKETLRKLPEAAGDTY